MTFPKTILGGQGKNFRRIFTISSHFPSVWHYLPNVATWCSLRVVLLIGLMLVEETNNQEKTSINPY